MDQEFTLSGVSEPSSLSHQPLPRVVPGRIRLASFVGSGLNFVSGSFNPATSTIRFTLAWTGTSQPGFLAASEIKNQKTWASNPNNQSFYNSEEHGIEVAKFRKRPVENAGIGTHVDDPAVNFSKVAEGFGVHSEGPIRNPADLRPAIERALKVVKEKKLPALVDVVCEPR